MLDWSSSYFSCIGRYAIAFSTLLLVSSSMSVNCRRGLFVTIYLYHY